MKSKRGIGGAVSIRISVSFLISGLMSLIFSLYSESQILAFIGLGLTFWGALFILLKPLRLVEGSLLYNVTVSTYLTTDRMLDDFGYKGKSHYLSPYPKDVYLPEYLKGLKTSVVFISANKNSEMPSIEEIAKGKFMSKSQKGVLVTPPGLGVLTQIEDKMNVDFTKMDLNYLCEVLPPFIFQDLNLAKDVTMEQRGDQVHLTILNSVYKDLYSAQENLRSVNILGCPIASAVACALAKTSGRTVTIQKNQVSPDGSAIEVWYRIVEG